MINDVVETNNRSQELLISETFVKKRETTLVTTSLGKAMIQEEQITTRTFDKRLGPKPR
jgi:hypothetical protein